MKITKLQIQKVEKQLKFHESEAARLKHKIYSLKTEAAIKKSGRPIYDYRKFKQPELNISNAYETKTIWWDTGTFSDMALSNVSIWVCKYCKTPARKKYIATGHDHTDYSYDVCDCAGAKRAGGKHYSKLD